MTDVKRITIDAEFDFSSVAMGSALGGTFSSGRRGWKWLSQNIWYTLPCELMGFESFTVETSNTAAGHCACSYMWFKGAGFGPVPRPGIPGRSFGALTKRPVVPRPPVAGASREDIKTSLMAILLAHESSIFEYANRGLAIMFLKTLKAQFEHVTPAGLKIVTNMLWELHRTFISGRSSHLISAVGMYANSEGNDYFTLQTLTLALLKNRRNRLAFDNHTEVGPVDALSEASDDDAGDLITNWSEDLSNAAVTRFPTVPVTRLRAIVYGTVQQGVRANLRTLIDISAHVEEELEALIVGPLDRMNQCALEHVTVIADLTRRLQDSQRELGDIQVRVAAAAEREQDYLARIALLEETATPSGYVVPFLKSTLAVLKSQLTWSKSVFSRLKFW